MLDSAALITALSHCLHSSHYQSSVSQITEVTASSLSARDHVSQMAPLCPQLCSQWHWRLSGVWSPD